MKQPCKHLSRICKNKKLISTFNEFVQIQTQGRNVQTQNPTESAPKENYNASIKIKDIHSTHSHTTYRKDESASKELINVSEIRKDNIHHFKHMNRGTKRGEVLAHLMGNGDQRYRCQLSPFIIHYDAHRTH